MSPPTSDTKQSIEKDLLLDHAYDGILEYDNPMPSWWVWIFWGTFWFSGAYLFHYWVGNGESDLAEYAAEQAAANKHAAEEAMKQTVSEESLGVLLVDASSVEAGKSVFLARCAACHTEAGTGSIGPNLTDNAWIHGKGTLLDIFTTVATGVPEKGMPAWDRQLTPLELRQVVSFVGTLRGTNLPGKAPEGTPL